MEKIKEYKGIIIIVLIVILGAFYWFQLRPTNIKKSCSQQITIIPADVGVTKEQAEQNANEFEQCKLKYPAAPFRGSNPIYSIKFYQYMKDTENYTSETQKIELNKCEEISANTIERNPSPETKKVSKVLSENTYNRCLREHGL